MSADREAIGSRDVDIPADEMRSRFGSTRIARLATVRPDGAPHLVPVTFVLDGKDENTAAFAVDAKPKTTWQLQRLRNLQHDPRVSLLVDSYAEDWSRLWWVRADGIGRIVEGAGVDRWVRRLQAKYQQYLATPPDGPVVEITVERWTGWRSSPEA
jgi:PPOX class probable F420-dependent enzyme